MQEAFVLGTEIIVLEIGASRCVSITVFPQNKSNISKILQKIAICTCFYPMV